jgi:hypothetical protein
MGKFLVAVHQLSESDGRLRRSERTRQALIEAYLDLLGEKQQPPTTPEIAKRAGCSIRLVYERFSDLRTLSAAAADHAFAQVSAQASVPNVDADLHTRLTWQVESRAAICERWLARAPALPKRIGRAGNSGQTHTGRDGRAAGACVRAGTFNAVRTGAWPAACCLGHPDRFRELGKVARKSRPVDRSGARYMDQCHWAHAAHQGP